MEHSLTTTIERERPRLLAWMSARIDAEEAEDALQDIIVKSLVNLDALEGVRDLTAWIWRSARNAVIDRWRKRRRRRKTAGPESAAKGQADSFESIVDDRLSSVEDAFEAEALLGSLTRAIRGLPEEQREVVVAQCLRGETFQSISDRTGISIDTLAARKRYALARLRRNLGESGWDER